MIELLKITEDGSVLTLLCHGSERYPNYLEGSGDEYSTHNVSCAKGAFDYDVLTASCKRRLEPGKTMGFTLRTSLYSASRI